MEQVWGKVDEYIKDKLMAKDDVLEQTLIKNKQAGLPEIDVSPAQGKLLYLLAKTKGAKRILEIGTLGGYSTIWLARALEADGELMTLEAVRHHAETAQQNIDRAGLAERVTILQGKALDTLSQLKEQDTLPFDLIFIDADKPNNPKYLKWALHFSKKGTVIIADNVVRNGAVLHASDQDERVKGTREFFDLLKQESRIEATAIQTVGEKGYDGFIYGIVK
ncbi:O-methyltransferase [Bacillus altitudinis MN12]|uniref:O-methyltransferase n=1 Tax=Bacillus TaxID=1386 RepID=UPI00045C9B92|nr:MULTISPECIES: O-methyltransferase [Bacillus]KDE27411.1 O-methyltransferase [Bacillus altitudinis 41KF2b]MBR0585068.1 O-methyltransferase [Bacillus altitudinis MN12]MBR0596192.1 O-methyltransferase [Bacillus altitudinis C16B11]MBR0611629.1 O-methyltransferase [Bacillus altitudinis]MBR0629641.1 O-methyltransferase [Bacillus altitudinis S70-5-12]